jgi:hypothetical protein
MIWIFRRAAWWTRREGIAAMGTPWTWPEGGTRSRAVLGFAEAMPIHGHAGEGVYLLYFGFYFQGKKGVYDIVIVSWWRHQASSRAEHAAVAAQTRSTSSWPGRPAASSMHVRVGRRRRSCTRAWPGPGPVGHRSCRCRSTWWRRLVGFGHLGQTAEPKPSPIELSATLPQWQQQASSRTSHRRCAGVRDSGVGPVRRADSGRECRNGLQQEGSGKILAHCSWTVWSWSDGWEMEAMWSNPWLQLGPDFVI